MDQSYSYILYYQGLGFIFTLALCALFSFIETSITALRIFKLKELAESTKKYSSLFELLETQPNKILFTILIANNFASASCTGLITAIMSELFIRLNWSEGLGLTAGIAIATCAIVVFGEIIPKNIARSQGDRLLKYTLGITYVTYHLLKPFVIAVTNFANLIMSPFVKNHNLEIAPSEQELSFIIDYTNKKGLIDKHKTSMLLSIFKLSEKSIKEIVIPEPEMICIQLDSTVKDTLEIYKKYQFSRLPVYENTMDNIVGIIYIKELIYKNLSEDTKIQKFIRPVMFVPESMKVSQLLRQFKETKKHMAIVLNEFGGIEGLVTLEDVLEEIVGPIIDEHEKAPDDIIRFNDQLLVNASINLEELKKVLNIEFETKAISLGGFIIETLQRLPSIGESLNYKDYQFRIENATPKKIIKVMISERNLKGDSYEKNADVHAISKHPVPASGTRKISS